MASGTGWQNGCFRGFPPAMWIVRVALQRPYTFVVLALLILGVGPLMVLRTPVDIFPNIDIPVVAAIWNYGGLSAPEMADRITSNYERILTTGVNDIEHIESQSLRGTAVVKIFFQPGHEDRDRDRADHGVVAGGAPPDCRRERCRRSSSATTRRACRSCSSALSGRGLSEQQLFDIGANFMRRSWSPSGARRFRFRTAASRRRCRSISIPRRCRPSGLSPADVVNAIGQQNLILPSGTSKIGGVEYDVDLNASPKTIDELNDLPDQDGRAHADLHPRRRARPQRLSAADQHRARRRPALGADGHHEERQRLDARRRRQRPRRC